MGRKCLRFLEVCFFIGIFIFFKNKLFLGEVFFLLDNTIYGVIE